MEQGLITVRCASMNEHETCSGWVDRYEDDEEGNTVIAGRCSCECHQ